MRTWHKEAAVAAVILSFSGIASVMGGVPVIVAVLSGLAVFATFLHAQVAARLSEAATVGHLKVECYFKERYYYVAKEILWLLLFVITWNLPALAGCIFMLLYPVWRQYHNMKKL